MFWHLKAFQTFRVGQKSNLLVTAAATEAVAVLSCQANYIESHNFQKKNHVKKRPIFLKLLVVCLTDKVRNRKNQEIFDVDLLNTVKLQVPICVTN